MIRIEAIWLALGASDLRGAHAIVRHVRKAVLDYVHVGTRAMCWRRCKSASIRR